MQRSDRWRRLTALALLAALGGCDLPTEAPILGSRWIMPADGAATIELDPTLSIGG